jgi:hypothetical protein
MRNHYDNEPDGTESATHNTFAKVYLDICFLIRSFVNFDINVLRLVKSHL